jgi:hypothetical protein
MAKKVKKINGRVPLKIRKQPRLKDGAARIPKYAAMHEAIQIGLEKIARSERKSVSWVIHEIIAEFFGRDVMGDKL